MTLTKFSFYNEYQSRRNCQRYNESGFSINQQHCFPNESIAKNPNISRGKDESKGGIQEIQHQSIKNLPIILSKYDKIRCANSYHSRDVQGLYPPFFQTSLEIRGIHSSETSLNYPDYTVDNAFYTNPLESSYHSNQPSNTSVLLNFPQTLSDIPKYNYSNINLNAIENEHEVSNVITNEITNIGQDFATNSTHSLETTKGNTNTCNTFETFCTVPGRTSLLSSTTKYKVTIAEVQRRISPPECLNASLLGAKSKDGGKTLRDSLKQIGLSLPAGRRKSASVTAWTALVEEEALHMARDFHTVCERDFPAKEIAIFTLKNWNGDEEIHRRRILLQNVKIFIRELSELMNMDRSPICGNRPDIVLDPFIQRPLTHFSMVTHGFGGLAVIAVLDALNKYVHESFRYLDWKCGASTTQQSTQNQTNNYRLNLQNQSHANININNEKRFINDWNLT